MSIIIKNLKVKNYNITLELNDFEKYIICGDMNIIREFLMYVAGINNCDSEISFNGKAVFENQEYFEKRVYIDMHIKYLNSIIPSVIKKTIAEKFNKSFNEVIFKNLINVLDVRKEVRLLDKFVYSDIGVSLINYCFFRSLEVENLIIHDLFYNINDQIKCQKILEDLLNINNQRCLISVNNINYFFNKKNSNDKLKFIFFGDYDNVLIIDPKNDKFIIINDDLHLNNRLFKLENGQVICKVEGNEILRKGLFNRLKYKEFGFYDALRYRLKYEKINV